jgi:hypothetical protein
MQTPRKIACGSVLSAALLLSPLIAFAGGNNAPAQPKPKPDTKQVKVWTNEDLKKLSPITEQPYRPAPPNAAPPAEAANLESSAVLPPEKDPRWYAQQLAALDEELARVTEEEDQLRHFRETGTGLSTGLNVAAPCNGVTTDNRIAQLETRRLEILQQLDDLADTARVNDMPPGILVEGRGLVSPETPLTPEQQKEALVERYEDLAGQLEETQITLNSMNEDADALHATLLQPDPRWGGNMTTNLLQALYQRQDELKNQIDATQDELRRAGITAP